MRMLLIVVSLIALAWLATEIHRAPDTQISRWCVPWLAAQTVFVAFGLFAMRHSSTFYMNFFYGMLSVVAICAAILTIAFLADFPSWIYAGWFAWSVLSFASGLAGVFVLLLVRANVANRFSFAHVACCSALLFCGICGIVSLLFSQTAIDGAIRFWLSLFWILIGIFGLVDSGMYLRQKQAAMAIFQNAPMVFAIVLFSFLAISLRSHREIGREPLPIISAIDAHVARLRGVALRKAG